MIYRPARTRRTPAPLSPALAMMAADFEARPFGIVGEIVTPPREQRSKPPKPFVIPPLRLKARNRAG